MRRMMLLILWAVMLVALRPTPAYACPSRALWDFDAEAGRVVVPLAGAEFTWLGDAYEVTLTVDDGLYAMQMPTELGVVGALQTRQFMDAWALTAQQTALSLPVELLINDEEYEAGYAFLTLTPLGFKDEAEGLVTFAFGASLDSFLFFDDPKGYEPEGDVDAQLLSISITPPLSEALRAYRDSARC